MSLKNHQFCFVEFCIFFIPLTYTYRTGAKPRARADLRNNGLWAHNPLFGLEDSSEATCVVAWSV